jgi:hypothetical protein
MLCKPRLVILSNVGSHSSHSEREIDFSFRIMNDREFLFPGTATYVR